MRYLLPLIIFMTSLFAEEEVDPQPVTLRTSFLQSLDKMLASLFNAETRTYAFRNEKEGEIFKNSDPYILHFDADYGYFSEDHPIVGRVTDSAADFTLAAELLLKIHNKILDGEQCEIMVAEVLTKLVAYRNLKPGMVIPIPRVDPKQGPVVIPYKVDEVIDIWRGMPAFGLLPQQKGNGPPILLFRGTDFSLVTEKGWASIISDLEIHDPGLSTFSHGQSKIHSWLTKVAKQGSRARVMGFSLGGILAAYTLLYEGDLVSSEYSSISFNPPGVSREILQEWSQMPSKIPFVLFVTQGDLIPKYGLLLGKAFLLLQEELASPLKAHTELITLAPIFQLQKIDLISENSQRKR